LLIDTKLKMTVHEAKIKIIYLYRNYSNFSSYELRVSYYDESGVDF